MEIISKGKPGKRILFIKPSVYDQDGNVIRGRKSFFPSRTFPYLAALTPPDYDIRMIDEVVQGVRGDEEADIVALSGMLPNMPRAMDLARLFHDRGVTTMIGGIGVFSVREKLEACGHFDCIVDGEAEGAWTTMLEDYQKGRLQPFYHGGHDCDMKGLPTARYELMDMSHYWRMPGQPRPWLAVETGRGCPFDCSYCAVTIFFGKKMRYRPIGEVVEEIKKLGARYYIFADDNLFVSPARARELFKALIPLNIQWGCQVGISAAQHPDILTLAGQSGCRNAMVGIESLVPQNLIDTHKPQGVRMEVEEVARVFHESGIAMTASMIFALDHETPESLEYTIERMAKSGADFMLPWTLCPGPGSAIHAQLKREGRLLHENYNFYNGMDVVYQPKHMSPKQLAEGGLKALKTFYRIRPVLARAWRANHKLDVLGLSLYFRSMARRNKHPFSGVV